MSSTLNKDIKGEKILFLKIKRNNVLYKQICEGSKYFIRHRLKLSMKMSNAEKVWSNKISDTFSSHWEVLKLEQPP